MPINRIALIGLSVLGLTATITIALAQNTSNPMLSGNTTNPRLSGNTVTQRPRFLFLRGGKRRASLRWLCNNVRCRLWRSVVLLRFDLAAGPRSWRIPFYAFPSAANSLKRRPANQIG
jgi:hypothetical protein